jgi:hypothetical protein
VTVTPEETQVGTVADALPEIVATTAALARRASAKTTGFARRRTPLEECRGAVSRNATLGASTRKEDRATP